MRFDGTIKSWNEERGFGFIEPICGGQDIFVHIKAMAKGTARSQPGLHVTFEVETAMDGKKRASRVEVPLKRAPRPSTRTVKTSRESQVALMAFLSLYLVAFALWHVPLWMTLLYVAGSLISFLAYAIDKSAAREGRWRIAESTLLLLGLAGGWPGAIVAQQVLRHKSSKASFRAAFWVTVVLNIATFVVWVSPLRAPVLQLVLHLVP